MADEFDVLIVGAGPVGASLGCALGDSGLRVGILEATSWGGVAQPSYDDRPLALSLGTRRILGSLGLWSGIADDATPIRHIHISERSRFGVTRIGAEEQGVDALGYVLSARALGAVLRERLEALSSIPRICPARATHISREDDALTVQYTLGDRQESCRTKLLVAADGGQSSVRELLGIGVRKRPYGQMALAANVTPSRRHANIAYERFSPTGPLALLPMANNHCGLVWTMGEEQAKACAKLSEHEFLQRLGEQFGSRLGEFRQVGKRAVYPLALLRAERQICERAAILGNAAHTLHPVAGQGFNLGLRDVAALAEILVDGLANGEDPGSAALLEEYARWRQQDQRQTSAFTDGLIRIFCNDLPLLSPLRGLALLGMDLAGPLKARLARQAMGLAGRLPRLSRGLAL